MNSNFILSTQKNNFCWRGFAEANMTHVTPTFNFMEEASPDSVQWMVKLIPKVSDFLLNNVNILYEVMSSLMQ